jgi:nucleoside-diphosphate-sugar epimerase
VKILVIGSGFIGMSIIHRLHAEGHDVLAFSQQEKEEIMCQQIQGDIFNFDEFFKVLDWRPQVVIHTAWITTPGLYRDDPSNYLYAEFTIKLAEIIAKSNVEHFIVLGTCAEYGQLTQPSIAGFTPLNPLTLYAKQKVFTFDAVKDLFQFSRVRFTWARVFYPYGPGQHHRRLIQQIISSLEKREPIRLADTSSTYDWVSTTDIASAISWMISNNTPIEVDVGTSFGYTNLELLSTIESLMNLDLSFSRSQEHDFGNKEFFVVDKDSPLLAAGWFPSDSLVSGLERILSK